jgi:hypothetical protein
MRRRRVDFSLSYVNVSQGPSNRGRLEEMEHTVWADEEGITGGG